ncbi:hypothetical protein GCK32_004319 [Trichostrongylus colubriformis]|uniref:Uncharacterized protein n=1 Tax=Trichostrongylus colubriformis TaxID=6319 RepID=A0AAN8FNR8_TRICO
MFDSGTVIFFECIFVLVPLYYSMVAAKWIKSTSKAAKVLSSVKSPKKLTEGRTKRLQIDHGDSVSSFPPAEVEMKVKARRHEIGDSNLLLSSRDTTSAKM